MTTELTDISDRYEIRQAVQSDYGDLVSFIDRHWRKDHIFGTSKKLLDWQHFDPTTQRYNFIVGIERASRTMHGVLGFIPLSQFDPVIEISRLVWMAMWKVQQSARGCNLGRHLMTQLENLLTPEIMSTVGATSMTLPMYQARGYQTGSLHHYYILNPEKSPYALVSFDQVPPPPIAPHGSTLPSKLVPLYEEGVKASTSVFLTQEELPRKTPIYVVNRYLRHPVFEYHAYAIQQPSGMVGLIVTRICCHDNARAIRIVEFVGPPSSLHGLRSEWLRLMNEQNAEFIDFYNAGIDDGDLRMSGFTRRIIKDGVTIPNYFEPFVPQNIEIEYAIRLAEGKRYRIVKGDSDQDRPNSMERLRE